jgi:hypothetical protein
MFCALGLVFGGTERVGVRFHILRSRTSFRRYRGRRVSFSSFVLPESFSAVPRASDPIFMFCAPGLIFGGTEGVGTLSHVLRDRTRFRRYRGRRVSFSRFVPQDSFSAVPGAGSCFLLLRFKTRFRRFRGRWVQFSCFANPYSFSAVPKASDPVFMFCAPELVFGGNKGAGSRFHV